jgi:hypothetical protein
VIRAAEDRGPVTMRHCAALAEILTGCKVSGFRFPLAVPLPTSNFGVLRRNRVAVLPEIFAVGVWVEGDEVMARCWFGF